MNGNDADGWPTVTQNGDEQVPGTSLVPVFAADPTPPQSRSKRLRLGTVKEVQRELACVYREARTGQLPTQTATRLAYLLNLMATMIVQTDLESRVEVLEQGRKG